MWSMRNGFHGRLTSVSEALEQCRQSDAAVCLLDMGDNVGGGSSADGADLLAAIHHAQLDRSFGCLFDPVGRRGL